MKKALFFLSFFILFGVGCGSSPEKVEDVPVVEVPVVDTPSVEEAGTVDFDYYVDALMEKQYQDYSSGWDDFITKEQFFDDFSPELDYENYYGRLNPLYAEYDVIFALFLRENDTPIIAVDHRECAPFCDQTLTFWTYEDGVWTDVSGIFPFLSDEELAAKTQELENSLGAG